MTLGGVNPTSVPLHSAAPSHGQQPCMFASNLAVLDLVVNINIIAFAMAVATYCILCRAVTKQCMTVHVIAEPVSKIILSEPITTHA